MSEKEVEGKGREESRGKTYRIPVRAIVANTNPRNPLGALLQREGYTVFEGEKAVWPLATSDDPEQRQKFVELMKTDDEFVGWASTFLTQGQLQPVEVRDNGKKAGGQSTYTLVFGCRRCLAILFNWCLLGRPKEPVVEARLAKGNNASLLQRAAVENFRKNPSKVEEARAMRLEINAGSTEEDVAEARGVSVQTVQLRLKLLELEPRVQQLVHEGRLSVEAAFRRVAVGGKEAPTDVEVAESNTRRRLRPRKEVEEALKEFNENEPQYRALAWVLGLRKKIDG